MSAFLIHELKYKVNFTYMLSVLANSITLQAKNKYLPVRAKDSTGCFPCDSCNPLGYLMSTMIIPHHWGEQRLRE